MLYRVAATGGTFLGNQGLFQFSSPLWLWITYEKIGATLWKSTSWTRKLTPVSPLSRHHTCRSEEWQFINFILPMIPVYDGIRDFYTMALQAPIGHVFANEFFFKTNSHSRKKYTKILTLTLIFSCFFHGFPDVFQFHMNLGGGTSSKRRPQDSPRGVQQVHGKIPGRPAGFWLYGWSSGPVTGWFLWLIYG